MPHQESAPVAKTNSADFTKLSSSLPFGQQVPLSSISGPTYVTAQLLVQQIAYKLSDKIFSYSPETFDLDGVPGRGASCGPRPIRDRAAPSKRPHLRSSPPPDTARRVPLVR